TEDTEQQIIRETFHLVSKRDENVCNFLEGGMLIGGSDYKLIYRHYATLYFVFCVDSSESELGILDLIQVFVETLDKCFENVCELDLIFHVDKVHNILAEMVMGGMVLETNMNEIITQVDAQNKMEKSEFFPFFSLFTDVYLSVYQAGQAGIAGAPARAVSAVKNMNLPEMPRNINIGDISIKVPNLPSFKYFDSHVSRLVTTGKETLVRARVKYFMYDIILGQYSESESSLRHCHQASSLFFPNSIKEAVTFINTIDVNKFSRLISRIIQKLHLKGERTFSEEEEQKLQAALSLDKHALNLVLETAAFILEQAMYHNVKPASLQQQLEAVHLNPDKAEMFSQTWATAGPELVERLKQNIFAPKKLEYVGWQLNLQMAQSSQARLKSPSAVLQLGLGSEESEGHVEVSSFRVHKMSKKAKYLGVHLDNKLDWTTNTDAIYKKGQSRLFILRRLRSFNVCRTMLQMFYHSVVSSLIFYTLVCWCSRLKTADTNRLNKLIRRAGSVLGVELESVAELSERRMLKKLLSIMDNVSHPLHATLMSCQSSFSRRLRPPRSSLNATGGPSYLRLSDSIIPPPSAAGKLDMQVQENVFVEFNHQELLEFYNKLEIVQGQLDSLT
ncbi:hypothetical protein L3Q82_023183, partial [Scortum barcoo]